MKAVILIGGMGTRLRPLTCQTPKPLLPIVNRPFLEYQLDLLKKHGIRDVMLCVAYLPDAFREHFGDGKKWGMKIRYVHEKEPLGTGGAIRNAAGFIDAPVFILNGDILTDIDLTAMARMHKTNKSGVTIALTRVKDPSMYGLVETGKKGRIIRFLEKPSPDEISCNTINAGIYLFDPEVLDFIPEGINYSVERGLFPELLSRNYPLYGYTYDRYWLDIGTIEKYMQAHFDILQSRVMDTLPGKCIENCIWAGKRFRKSDEATVKGTLVCGDNVRIDANAQLLGTVSLGNNVSVGRGCIIANSVILDGTAVEEGARIDNALLGRDCVIGSYASISPHRALGDGTIIRGFSRL